MPGQGVSSVEGIGLADAIGALRDELLKARAAGGKSEIQLPVESMTIELKVAATKAVGAKGGFKVPFIEFELGGDARRERHAEHLVTVVFAGPLDRQGNPVPIAEETDELKG
jgi:hypothetical protein